MNAPTAARFLARDLSPEEARDEEIARRAVKIAATTRSLIRIGHAETLHDFANAIGDKLSEQGVCERLVQASLTSDPLTVGEIFTAMLLACIAADADTEATKQVERDEKGGAAADREARADRADHDRAMA